jgi:hypothetical protein
MRWSCLLAVFGLSVTCVASFAQRPPGGQRLAATRSASHANGFFATTGMVRFQMIQGRLCLDVPRHRKGSQQREIDGQCENITVTAQRGIPSLHYVYKSNHQQVTLSVDQARSIRVESWLVESDERSVLTQPDIGPVVLLIRRGDLHDRYEGASLLHVRHLDVAGFDRHFGLLTQRMMRGESLHEISDATQQLVFKQIGTTSAPTLQAVQEQVENLRSKKRANRVSAERQLLSWGTPIIPALRWIDQRDLDAQQKAKVQSIAKRLRPRATDTPASLARLMAGDRTYWTAISSRLDRDQVRLVSQHLERLGVKPIEFQTEPVERIAAAND